MGRAAQRDQRSTPLDLRGALLEAREQWRVGEREYLPVDRGARGVEHGSAGQP